MGYRPKGYWLHDKGTEYQHLKGGNFVGATVFKKLKEKYEFSSGMGICCCMFTPTQLSYPNFQKSLHTETFNHLVADFSRHRLTVHETDGAVTSDVRTKNDVCCYAGEYLIGKVRNEYSLASLGTLRSFVVDISEYSESALGGGFNHAACQCVGPAFSLVDYVNISSYPYLNHVHVCVVAKGGHDKTVVWVSYGGIAAL